MWKCKFRKYLDRNLPSKIETFLVCTIYRPPENSKHLHENFARLFDDMLSMRNFKKLILTGILAIILLEMVFGQLPPRKIVPRFGLKLRLGLVLGFGVIFLGDNCPRTGRCECQLSNKRRSKWNQILLLAHTV